MAWDLNPLPTTLILTAITVIQHGLGQELQHGM
jgi:multisubunit Na+/H+ antiporter MnhC subunit